MTNTKQNSKLILALTLTACLAFANACAKKKSDPTAESAVEAPPFVTADNSTAHLSDIMQKMRGRWVKEVADPNSPNPPTMRLFAVADNMLQGRLLFAGPFDDTGVLATLKQEGAVFTLSLVDDDLRPHDWIPKERILVGAYDAEKKELTMKSKDGSEWVTFQLPGGFTIKFSGNVLHCVVIPVVTGPSGGSGSSGSSGSTGTTPAPAPAPGPSGSHLRHLVDADEAAIEGLLSLEPNPAPTVRPTAPRPGTPPAKFTSCGIAAYYEDNWSRMSGSGP